MKKVIRNLFTWKPVKVSPIKLFGYPARSKREVRLIDRKPFADSDRDKLMNWFDCKPLNKKQHSKMLRREIADRIFGGAYFSGLPPPSMDNEKEKLASLSPSQRATFKSATKAMGPELVRLRKERTKESIEEINKEHKTALKGLNESFNRRYRLYPKYRKGSYKAITEAEIVKFFEKNPDLIKKAEEVEWTLLDAGYSLAKGTAGEYGPAPDYKERKREIGIAEALPKKGNLPHTIKHELSHHEQYKGDTYFELQKAEERELKKLNEEKAAEWKKKGRKTEFSPYYRLPHRLRPIEIDAEKRAAEPTAREIAKSEGEKSEVLASLDIYEEGD